MAATDPRWLVSADPVDAGRRRAWEAIMTVSDGRFGTRGLAEADDSPTWPASVAAGVFDDADPPALLSGPLWAIVDLIPNGDWIETAVLDLRHAVLTQTFRHRATGDIVNATKFASLERSGVAVLEVVGPSRCILESGPLRAPTEQPDAAVETRTTPPSTELIVATPTGTFAAVALQHVVDDADERCLTRFSVNAAANGGTIDVEPMRIELAVAVRDGFEQLLVEQRTGWDRRWAAVGSDIDGARDLDLAIKFTEFSLLGCAPAVATDDDCEVAIGARGLTGSAYLGHVFWDTDVFVLPALCALAPNGARAALTYRSNRIAAAQERSRQEGRAGARFPWESADTGHDVTPTHGRNLRGETVAILTGQLEEHIVADVAWAVGHYIAWTGDLRFLHRRGAELLTETARYWASRIEVDDDATGHIRGVIGPDEYHERVDDNAFTNVMARHNLRLAADVCHRLDVVDPDEWHRWHELADCLVDGFDEKTSIYEQFQGYHQLEPMLVSSIGTPPLPADVLLGHDTTQRSQVIKQPDVLMLHHLVPDEVRPDTLVANLDFYLPRTAHGSSLSPGICAGLLARGDRLDEAERWFSLAARLDLDDVARTTSGGLHVATMGGVWQALNQGFLGVRPRQDGISIDPRVPAEWGRLRHRFIFRSAHVSVEVEDGHFVVSADRSLTVSVNGDAATGHRHDFERTAGGWERR
jgi:trehalose/maltose hydrolase-like predicted phosphorylase